jgi:glycosyltransferase involved in cell wall biosynthesis
VWEEAFGLTIAEAMACGRAVVATRVGAIPELVDDGVNGLLVPPADAQALASALDRLTCRPQLRRELGRHARAKAERFFGLQRCADQHVRQCEGAVARSRLAWPRLHP